MHQITKNINSNINTSAYTSVKVLFILKYTKVLIYKMDFQAFIALLVHCKLIPEGFHRERDNKLT